MCQNQTKRFAESGPGRANQASNGTRFQVGCLFAAIGGFCRAFHEVGATITWANEQDRFAAETFKLNFPDIRYLHKPIEELFVDEDRLEPVDVLTAGFPCQPFSIAGDKLGFKDERGLLFLHIIRLIKEFGRRKPKVLLLENVRNFKAHDKGRTFKRVQTEIQKAGYWFTEANTRIMNTVDYTKIPQNRDRIFMVALSREHFGSNNFQFPEPLPPGSLRKVREFLDLNRKPPEEFYFKPGSQYHPFFQDAIEAGERDSVYQLRRSYVRENKSGVCFTLMANMGDGGHNTPVIKDRWGIRKLTPRECARLQGYEDSWFRIPPTLSRTQISKQIGNRKFRDGSAGSPHRGERGRPASNLAVGKGRIGFSMESLNWTFAKNEGGRDSGLHDAGVETFKGNFDRYLAREMIQNSLDARDDPNKPVLVKFELLELNRGDIPDMDCLKATLARCAEYWSHDKKARAFFKQAEALAKEPKITALRVGDYNTTGVLGSDTERSKNWYNLIRCAGSSSKGGGEGGSFGIGKNAPFAASLLRTVLYSTFNTDDEHVFQGVATLVSHNHPQGGISQPTGFLGAEKGASVRSMAKIPPKFIRLQHGADVIVLGFPAMDNWQNDLVYSVLDNFWPAIHFGDLEVKVGDAVIKKTNLQPLLEAFSGQEGFTANLFHQAFTDPTHKFHITLPRLHEVSLYLLAGDAEMPKSIAMVRKTGMKIFAKPFRSVIPFCGVLICRNDEGNKALREMEPPRHDVWDPDHPEKGANRRIESEYINFIRDCIRKLTPADDSKVISIPGLNRFLPDDDETPEESFDGALHEDSRQETQDRSPLPEKIPGRKMDNKTRSMQPDHLKPKGEDEETEDGEGEGTGDGPGNKQETATGTGGPGGGQGTGNAGGSGGSHGGANSKPPIAVRYRTYARDSSAGVYAVTVLAEKQPPGDAVLVIWTVGDDQKAHAEIKSARLASGADIEIRAPGVIGPVKLTEEEPLKLEVVLREPLRVAMEVSAHEA